MLHNLNTHFYTLVKYHFECAVHIYFHIYLHDGRMSFSCTLCLLFYYFIRFSSVRSNFLHCQLILPLLSGYSTKWETFSTFDLILMSLGKLFSIIIQSRNKFIVNLNSRYWMIFLLSFLFFFFARLSLLFHFICFVVGVYNSLIRLSNEPF